MAIAGLQVIFRKELVEQCGAGLQVIFRKELVEQCGAGLRVCMLTSAAFRTKP